MKAIKFLVFALIAININFSCSSQTATKEENTQVTKAEKVEVLYFHYTKRCATCNAVESVSKDALSELYGDKVSFTDYNLDEQTGEEKGKELEVSGQTLLILAGTAKINITNEAFMNARSNPDKLKQIIKQNIDPYL